MALADYKYSFLMVIMALVYFQFYHHGHDHEHAKLQITTTNILFHANWTKSLDDICCLDQFQSALDSRLIKTLDVSLSMSNLNEDDLRKIFTISKFQPYKNIKLDLSGLNITNSGIDYVLDLIEPSVQNLQLNLNGIPTKAGFGESLATKLNALTKLKELKVSLIMSIKPSEVQAFIKTHKPTADLDSFHLILIGNQITKQSLVDLQSYFSILDLNELHFNLYANKIGAAGAQILANALKSQLNLQNLHLDLYFNNITQIGTQNLTSVIQTMSKLKSLQLNLDFNYIKNEGGKALGNMLQNMTQLQSLHLGVASKNFGYLGFKYVIAGIQKLTQLKKLILRCGVNRVGYNGAQITKDMLAKMTALQHLEIGFVENYIGDDGIGMLAEQVASMKTLKRVYLNLGFNDAKSYGLIKTVKAFLNNKYELLHLSLSSNEFRDSDVKLIENHLSTLVRNNQQFLFDFTDTAISKTQMKRLEKVFSDGNQKNKKDAKISVNSIIPEEQPQKQTAKTQQPKASEQKAQAKTQTNKKQNTTTQL